jgi:hypothetical protein
VGIASFATVVVILARPPQIDQLAATTTGSAAAAVGTPQRFVPAGADGKLGDQHGRKLVFQVRSS